ncbi:DnaD domain protein [Cytobacillus sp. FSL W7-1323]|uniref:DnaD domain-containing protein n=1 Tax=Cytobacillus sp. FSL W7-1323 TaxID=2921700 RepID=UPI00315894F6
MTKLLLDERPLIVLPELAVQVGLNEAILLQQIHYWINKKNNLRDGRYWVYNTLNELLEQFPFWSVSTLRRTITSLKNKGVLITGNYNKAGFDKTVWYSIDYQELDKTVNTRCVQNEHTEWSNWTNGSGQNDHTNTLDFTKTSTENVVDVDSNQMNEQSYQLVSDFYQQNFGVLTPFISQNIVEWINDIGSELVIESMKRALKAQKPWSYAEGILKGWSRKNIKTIGDVNAADLEFEKGSDNHGHSSKVRRGRAQQSKSQNGTERVGRM